jgi:short-subunit dehydrogenase
LVVRIDVLIANVVLSNSGALVDQSNSVQVSMFDLNASSRRGG